MKRLIFILLLLPLAAFAQEMSLKESAVPTQIRDYVKQNYPAASKIEYSKEYSATSTYIEAEFRMGKDEMSLKFENEKLVEVEKAVDIENIPASTRASILAHLDEKYIKYKIRESEEVTVDGNTFYDIQILCKCSPTDIVDLRFNRSGEKIN